MRISDWSSDVCSSDLLLHLLRLERAGLVAQRLQLGVIVADLAHILSLAPMIGSRSVARSQAQDSGSEQKRSEEHTSELQSLMRISYAVFCLKKKKQQNKQLTTQHTQKTQSTDTTTDHR